MDDDEKPFDLTRPRYDQSTFMGRLRHFMDITDPRLIIVTPAEVQRAQTLLRRFAAGEVHQKATGSKGASSGAEEVSASELWQARKVTEAILHPDTGQPVPLPFRVSSFVPMNLLLAVGLLNAQGTAATVFFQWLNQSYNIALNHANRNASNTLSNAAILEAYGAAVATSCGVALGLGRAVRAATSRWPRAARVAQLLTPYTAVATAGAANVFLMRRNELQIGIDVKDERGQVYGKSPSAGLKAVTQVAISRAVTTLPILTVPPIAMAGLMRVPAVQRSTRLQGALQLGLITTMLLVALPPAIALFPQALRLDPRDLEPQFHNLKDERGQPVTALYCNRGL